MKHILLKLAAVSTLGLVACQTNPLSFTISGTIEAAQNGDSVYLQLGRNAIDTAIVADGKFTFKGVADSAQTATVLFPSKENYQAAAIVLEPGKITTDLKKYDKELGKNLTTIGGTANNILLQQLNDTRAVYYAQMNTVAKGFNEASDEEKSTITAKYGEIRKQLSQVEDSVMYANLSNPVGIEIFKSRASGLDVDKFTEVVAMLPVNYQNLDFIIKIKQINEVKKKVAEGQKFTDIELPGMDGKMVKLSDYAGKGNYVLVDFWASWCGPCIHEMPHVKEMYAKYKKQGFEIVGVSLDSDKAKWEAGTKELGVTWPQMSDLKGWSSEGAKLYAVRGIPFTVLVGPDGTIVANGLRGEKLTEKLAEIYK